MSSSPWASKEAAAFPDGTTDYEPLRSNTKDDPGRVHIADTPMTCSDIHLHINWLNTTLIIIIPIIGFISAYWTPLHLYTGIWAVILYFNTGLGITAGEVLSAGGLTATVLTTDIPTPRRTPYSVCKGLLYSHIGWMIFKRNPRRQGRTDITDLNVDPIAVWQHRNYFKCVILMALVMPTTVAGFGWGDWLGGFVYAGPFDDRNSPRDYVITAFVTLGEGYHNFYHEYPSDYRNAIKWYQYDPTKWSIWIWKQSGLAYNLKQFRQNEIEMGRKRATLDWGVPLEQLPVIHWDDFIADFKNGKALVAIAGVTHNVIDFIKDYPGDATAIFNGGIYNHSNAAHNLLSTMRVGILRGGCEVEIWKRARFENEDVSYMNNSAGQHLVRAGA
ncbi:related to stearoyl-CoA desaturase [Fusarium proliferatum]|nr:related to stearoyl-CoA desaturase [Fusarium proliferatum]